MQAIEPLKRAYNVGKCKRCCILSFGCCCSQKHKELKRKYFFKQWPRITNACDPDNIKYENLGFSKKSRVCRISFVWLIAIIMLVLSLIGIVFMKNKTEELKKSFNTDVVCPKVTTKEEAYFDQQLDQN
jgi:hypothetical protein